MAGRVKNRRGIKPLTHQGYERDRILVRTKKPKGELGMSKEDIDALINSSINNGNTMHPNGKCHDCNRPVSGERKFCGPCLARHK